MAPKPAMGRPTAPNYLVGEDVAIMVAAQTASNEKNNMNVEALKERSGFHFRRLLPEILAKISPHWQWPSNQTYSTGDVAGIGKGAAVLKETYTPEISADLRSSGGHIWTRAADLKTLLNPLTRKLISFYNADGTMPSGKNVDDALDYVADWYWLDTHKAKEVVDVDVNADEPAAPKATPKATPTPEAPATVSPAFGAPEFPGGDSGLANAYYKGTVGGNAAEMVDGEDAVEAVDDLEAGQKAAAALNVENAPTNNGRAPSTGLPPPTGAKPKRGGKPKGASRPMSHDELKAWWLTNNKFMIWFLAGPLGMKLPALAPPKPSQPVDSAASDAAGVGGAPPKALSRAEMRKAEQKRLFDQANKAAAGALGIQGTKSLKLHAAQQMIQLEQDNQLKLEHASLVNAFDSETNVLRLQWEMADDDDNEKAEAKKLLKEHTKRKPPPFEDWLKTKVPKTKVPEDKTPNGTPAAVEPRPPADGTDEVEFDETEESPSEIAAEQEAAEETAAAAAAAQAQHDVAAAAVQEDASQ